ncbi:MAG: phosphoribosylformylglycinamidine synthase [Firmicutes bacterium]|nr:phosphoribosylformylglycinamidine synthase [Bacillota bacterium]
MINRLYVEKKEGRTHSADKLRGDIEGFLGIKTQGVRVFMRYDVDGLTAADYERAITEVFSEPPVDTVHKVNLPTDVRTDWAVFAVELLPGQYDQRADSAVQCVQLLTQKSRPVIKCATVYAIKGISQSDLQKIKKFLINPVESRECELAVPKTLESVYPSPEPPKKVDGFIKMNKSQIGVFHKEYGFAMTIADLEHVRDYFVKTGRDPMEAELKVIDTYWSDHCRHTTFLTALDKVKIKSKIPQIKQAYKEYTKLFDKHYKGRKDKYPCLMDMATMGARELKAQGLLDNLDESEEVNACSIKVKIKVEDRGDVSKNKKEVDYLVMFKNETHNHPTEIEPFGGAATCLGGGIRDPLSGRAYVYQGMRVTGAADPTEPMEQTIKGKLPQRVICKTAAAGFSSYGNQIGVPTGMVKEIYHEGFKAKRMEAGFIVAASPAKNVVREKPSVGDVVLLLGGETGRDGCGGATGSSKAHTLDSLEECGAEVQKGNALIERKIQRLFRNGELTRLIKRCNDFGAGGVSVAVGEIAPSIDIDLDAVPLKYAGLNATEIAISESQERMAVVVAESDIQKFKKLCATENLDATVIAKVTDTGRMRMSYKGEYVVDIERSFLDTNGVRQNANAIIGDRIPKSFNKSDCGLIEETLSNLSVCSQKGLVELFDSTVGASTVLMPLGGVEQLTPAQAMAAKIPVLDGETEATTVSSHAFYPYLSSESPFIGSIYAVALSAIKVVLAGAPLNSIRLSFQEFFPRINNDPKRWGLPASALLGALHAQLGLGLGAIGGKDSMSGSFENLDVPPTLVSFALGVTEASRVVSNVLAKPNQKVWLLPLERDKNGVPDLNYLKSLLVKIGTEMQKGTISYASAVEEGGDYAQIILSCLGNNLGFETEFCPNGRLGDILISCDNIETFQGFVSVPVGTTKSEPQLKMCDCPNKECSNISLDKARAAFEGKLESVYPTTAPADGDVKNISSTISRTAAIEQKIKTVEKRVRNTASIIVDAAKNAGKAVRGIPPTRSVNIATPNVLIPVIPGTNGEYDVAAAFQRAGAKTEFVVVKNNTAKDITESVKAMAAAVGKSQIIAFPGGFSGGDEPDGSGKFIAATFRAKQLSDAIAELIEKRDGLIIGFCNGYQALIKLGLLPYGKIAPMKDDSPTLSFNNISRHVSTISRIRVASTLSPWFSGVEVGEIYNVPVSHGEGKFLATAKEIEQLIKDGQVATQYVDLSGNATMQSPYNPNGSMMAIEGITSKCGRILGKMGHSERVGKDLYKNVIGEYDMKIFKSGVEYFTK